MYKPAGTSNCSSKTIQVAIWLPNSIGSPGENNVSFIQFLSTVHAEVANSNPTNYEIGNQYSIFWAYKKPIFPKFCLLKGALYSSCLVSQSYD